MRSLIFLFILTFSGHFLGQIKSDSSLSSTKISVINGASIYSSDKSFNSQLINHSIIIDGITKVSKNIKNKESITIESVSKVVKPIKIIEDSVASFENQNQKEFLKKVKKQLDTIEVNKKQQVFFQGHSDKNLSKNCLSGNNFVISFNNNDYQFSFLRQPYFSINQVAGFYETLKIEYGQNQFLGYSMIDHIWVRPPPNFI